MNCGNQIEREKNQVIKVEKTFELFRHESENSAAPSEAFALAFLNCVFELGSLLAFCYLNLPAGAFFNCVFPYNLGPLLSFPLTDQLEELILTF